MEERVQCGVQAVRRLAETAQQERQHRPALIEHGDDTLQLLVCAIKVNQLRRPQTIKIQLPHSIQSEASVCLLVKDLQPGIRVDHELSEHHWLQVLRSAGVQRVTKVMPFRQLRAEFCMYEARRRLAATYDVFLTDSAIVHMLSSYLGKHFHKANKLPAQVNMQSKSLASDIDRAIDTAYLRLYNTGANSCVQVGRLGQTDEQLKQNVLAAVATLEQKFPGGFENVRALFLRTPRTTVTVPVYQSEVSENEVPVPVAPPRAGDSRQPLVGELSTCEVRSDVIVKPNGEVTVVPRPIKRRAAKIGGKSVRKIATVKKPKLKAKKSAKTVSVKKVPTSV